ncbi:hypothetical protein ERO13_A11G291300v2 [Gossypium hirsutum]|uniref:Uncharacterized protein n=1 Tax=Gossypium darwinii TaxID=34276 RepID=A0A5D2ESV8_GOSDA|nr:hypothetical protein ERO13_A11G291300v2 [Gossypium hirsutum]TYG96367.1 hypothetical protein ES288_A11G344500v1 [Gossypium darwinii]
MPFQHLSLKWSEDQIEKKRERDKSLWPGRFPVAGLMPVRHRRSSCTAARGAKVTPNRFPLSLSLWIRVLHKQKNPLVIGSSHGNHSAPNFSEL